MGLRVLEGGGISDPWLSSCLQHQVAEQFFTAVAKLALHHGWVSNEHFSVDGTFVEAWASMKSFRPKDEPKGPSSGNAWMDFKGEKRRNDTHQSTTDAEAKLLSKSSGKEAKQCVIHGKGWSGMRERRTLSLPSPARR